METPSALVYASARMLPRLTAEESFLAASRVAVGTGALTASDAEAITAEWRQMTARVSPAPRRPSAADLAAIGVGLVAVPRV